MLTTIFFPIFNSPPKFGSKHGYQQFFRKYIVGLPILEIDLFSFSVPVSEIPGEGSSWLGLDRESISGPINFSHTGNWTCWMKTMTVSETGNRTGYPPSRCSVEPWVQEPFLSGPFLSGSVTATLDRQFSLSCSFLVIHISTKTRNSLWMNAAL